MTETWTLLLFLAPKWSLDAAGTDFRVVSAPAAAIGRNVVPVVLPGANGVVVQRGSAWEAGPRFGDGLEVGLSPNLRRHHFGIPEKEIKGAPVSIQVLICI